MSSVDDLLGFLASQQARQAPVFPQLRVDKVVTFMGTTSVAASHVAVGVRRLTKITATEDGKGLAVLLEGPLPRLPEKGECVTVSLANFASFKGYQAKTFNLLHADRLATVVEQRSVGESLLHCRLVYTIHGSPYVLSSLEKVPFAEVLDVARAQKHVVVAVGTQANLSPRFTFHHEARGNQVLLYQGEGYAHKTHVNLQTNKAESRLVVDLETFKGYSLRGQIEELEPTNHPEAYEKVCKGFEAGGWGKPTRFYRHVAQSWEKIAP